MYRVSTDAGGAASSLGVLVILKVIFVDILITGFGDAITDLLQGIYMIIEEPLNKADQSETVGAGIAVILICWVPGIVAILHLIASHKYSIPKVSYSYSPVLCFHIFHSLQYIQLKFINSTFDKDSQGRVSLPR